MSLDCWYVSYGSNMCLERFRCYLEGGCPPGGRRTYAGARDPAPPRASSPYWLDGGAYFAMRSRTWGGGMAFLDPASPGRTPARAYLVTRAQLDDVIAQEAGHYESMVECSTVDGLPAFTFTAARTAPDHRLAPPSAAYLRVLARGLAETHGWDLHRSAGYLASLPGARDAWTADDVVAAVAADARG